MAAGDLRGNMMVLIETRRNVMAVVNQPLNFVTSGPNTRNF